MLNKGVKYDKLLLLISLIRISAAGGGVYKNLSTKANYSTRLKGVTGNV